MLRSSEMMRIMTMLGLLAVLGMLITRARDPSMWRFFADEGQRAAAASDSSIPSEEANEATPAGQEQPVASSPKPDSGTEATKETKDEKPAAKDAAAKKPAGKSSPPGPLSKGEGDKNKKPPAEKVLPGPTDEDPEQRVEAENEAMAVADGSLGVQPEDMPLYWRVFLWSERQSMAEMKRRAKKDVVFNEFMQSPDKYRGRLVRMDLNVRRVLAYPVTDGPPEIKQVYEVWGFTEESKAWLYCVLTANLPEGMPVGPEVYERVSFVGYFFKLQGYREAGAKPHASALRAPLLIGRLTRYPSITERQTKDDSWWTWTLGGGALILIVGFGVYRLVTGRLAQRRRQLERSREVVPVRQWLDQDFPPDIAPVDPGQWPGIDVDSPAEGVGDIFNTSRPSSNGHGKPGDRVPE